MKRYRYGLFLRLAKAYIDLRQRLFMGLYFNRRKATLARADLSFLDLRGAKLDGADLREANLIRTDLSHVKLRGACLLGADLSGARLTGTDLTNAQLTGAMVAASQLRQAQSLQGATMPNGEPYRGEFERELAHSESLGEAEPPGANLAWRDLRGRTLRAVDLADANLLHANLAGVDLTEANLNGATLRGADLSRSVLHRADLRGADLMGARLLGAELRDADLTGALVSEQQLALAASLQGATLPDGSLHP